MQHFAELLTVAAPRPAALRRAAELLTPQPRITPDQWARENRVYGPSSALPGRRDPGLTPYLRAFTDFFADPTYETVVLVTSTQSGKTESALDAIGWQLDQKPRPVLFVGPSKTFVTDIFEPRLEEMLRGASRRLRVVGGKANRKTRKLVNGTSVRLAWAGSETSLSSDQAAVVMIDEYDKAGQRQKGVGDVFGLAKARADSYADRKICATSTPKRGQVGVERDPVSGLQFWSRADVRDIESPIWLKWQSGTRSHWCWRCPGCGEWFVPRMSCLACPSGAVPADARRQTWLACPANGCIVTEDHKAEMNRTGVYCAPGQRIGDDGGVIGEPRLSSTLSLWVSGLASPFVTWGERMEERMLAEASGDAEAMQGAANKAGELWAPDQGVLPEWAELKQFKLPYRIGEVPEGVRLVTAGCDVQGDRLVVATLGWGARGQCWVLDTTELYGPTEHDDVWTDLADLLDAPVGDLRPRMCFIDSGFRPGKAMPEHRVYRFTRENPRNTRPAKGYASRSTPLTVSRIETTPSGGKPGYGVALVRLDSDFFKSAVHARLARAPESSGALHLPSDVPDEFLRQLVAEARVVNPSGRVEWVLRSRQNHWLDAVALASAAGYMLGVQRIHEDLPRRPAPVVRPVVGSAPSLEQTLSPPPGREPVLGGSADPGPARRRLSDIGKTPDELASRIASWR